MGLKFGNLKRMSGITYFRLSPYEQKAFTGIVDGVNRMAFRAMSHFLRIGPFFLGGYMLREWACEENYKMHRKNPEDYANDV
ncbi:Cytochrome b-c1 complex subunit 8 [Habropoda laboriosa]|uniref:Cytochrome b-c1 complex subunit 8 n=1 Tax=Habropoda laboriosa TaxID=597456 RepID=A0A0L7QMJ3_9HYME|nr:PREDICTED: cytochrome b-c1 complex subunit 8 [Habropoda laboriosa]KOC59830.1 Cytochrome b-c1 complex subunit 8 [Habropoda laboriosa]